MLQLSKDDRKQLRTALASAFRDYSALEIFVSDHFDQDRFDNLRLNDIAKSQALKDAAYTLIKEAEAGGYVPELILALAEERPRNPEVRQLLARLQGHLPEHIALDPAAVSATEWSFEPPAYSDPQLESFLREPLSYETDVHLLLRGLRQASAVCKLSFTHRAATGTGVLIAPDLVLTNYHLLSHQPLAAEQLAQQAQSLVFEFGFTDPEAAPETFGPALQPLVAASPLTQLDYALLRVEPGIRAADITPVALDTSFVLAEQQALNLLQHPAGEAMKVSLSASGVVQVSADRARVWYVNRTQGGSSGAPCFNHAWKLVALHHASVSRGFGSIGEGIALAQIVEDIQRCSDVELA